MPTPRPPTYPSRGAWQFRNLDRDFDFWPMLDSISITQTHPEMTSTFTCSVADEQAALVFAVEDKCSVTFDGERIWVGHLKNVEESQVAEGGPRVWNLNGQDYTAMLEYAVIKRRRKRKKENVKRRIRWIIRQLERRVWNVASLDLSDLPDGVTIEAYDYFGSTVNEALEHVAEEFDGHSYIDFDNVFRMFKGTNDDTPAAPITLDNNDPDYATSFPFAEWVYSNDSVELANVVVVEPAKRKHVRIVKDTTSIAAYGRHERFLSDENLHRRAQARKAGQRVLRQDKDPTIAGGATVWEPGLQAGMWVDVVEGLWDHDFKRFIESVEISAMDPHDTNGKAYLRSMITFQDRRKGRRSRNKSSNRNARRRPGQTADTDAYMVDRFHRTVSSPGLEEGDPLTTAADYWKLSWGEEHAVFSGTAAAPPKLYVSDGATIPPALTASLGTKYVHGVAGNYNTPWTTSPCTLGPGAWSGWAEVEQWVDLLTVPAHPSDMAGIYVDVVMASGHGIGPSYGGKVLVTSAAPSVPRTGALVGVVPASATTTVFIPASAVPAAGEHLWVGIAPNWDPDYEDFGYVCGNVPGGTGYRNPVFSGAYHSGRVALTSIGNARWAVTSDDIPDLGETDVPRGAPWGEAWTWHLIGTEGAPVYGMDGNAWFVEDGGVGIALFGEREDEDEESGPWSDVAYGVELEFEVNALGGTANLDITTIGEGERVSGVLDMEADTITVLSPNTTDVGSYAFAAGQKYVACFDTRSGKNRGKVWQGPEPAAWNVECAMDETEDDQDRVVLWLRAGTGQRIRVTRIRMLPGGRDGQRVVREWVGYASGVEKTFTTRHPYREGTLYTRVNGINVPQKEDPDEAEFTLTYYPSAKAPIRATYIIDQGTGDD